MTDFTAEIEKFHPEHGIESASTPPSSWYTRPSFDELEKKMLKQTWQFVGHADMLKGPGSYFSGEFCGEPYFVTKTESNEIRAFYNVCSHHASHIVEGSGCATELTCPYHAWCYGLDGQLKRAPQMAGTKNFDREKLGLKPIAIQSWGPFILLNFSAQPKPLDQELNVLKSRLEVTGLDALSFVCRKTYELKCNWKVYVDNYLDGGYHVDHLHKGLAGQLDLDAYKIENFKTYTVQSCRGNADAGSDADSKDAIDFRERIGDEAIYAWLYPNFMINRYGSIMDTNWVIPLAHDRCLTVFDYYFDTKKLDAAFIESSLKASEQVQKEDILISEAVQKGLASSGYDVGRYAPRLETGAFLFHTLLKNDYGQISGRVSL